MFDVKILSEAFNFLENIEEKEREKIYYNIKKAQLQNDKDLFKKLINTDIWEFRTLFNNKQFRLLAFWDKRDNQNTLVICSNGFIKKTDKTPKSEIEKAEKIKKLYFEKF
jgi:phage-related protein